MKTIEILNEVQSSDSPITIKPLILQAMQKCAKEFMGWAVIKCAVISPNTFRYNFEFKRCQA